MEIVYAMLWQNWRRQRDAQQLVDDEVYLAELAEDLGFDAISCVEHHFDTEYAACPDNFVLLANVAARTSRVKLVTGAVILPWNDPLRVIEKYALLDHLSHGRLRVGFGRGLARGEYEGFGIPMDESRERFDEAAEMVLRGLRSGIASGSGKFYPQPEVEVHPKPRPELADDVRIVGMSPDSAVGAGALGARLLCFAIDSAEGMLPMISHYREAFEQATGNTAPPEEIHDFMFCAPTKAEVERGAVYAGRNFQEVIRHYEFAGQHFADTKGYQYYAGAANEIRETGMDEATRKYIAAQTNIGTPDEIVEKFEARSKVLGRTHIGSPAMFGGINRDHAAASMRLFASEVMPEMRRIDAELEKAHETVQV